MVLTQRVVNIKRDTDMSNTRNLSIIYHIALISFIAALGNTLQADCKMPDPPIFHAQGRIFAFEDLDPIRQKEVQTFEKLATGELNIIRPTGVNRLNNGTQMGVADPRTPEERYLEPDHPSGQPSVPQSNWKRVNCVALKNPEEVATQVRPRVERANVSFSTLPKINAPNIIRTSFVRTAQSIFPGKVDFNGDGIKEIVDPFVNPPGTNMLPTVFSNLRNTRGREILNTLPSTKAKPYNLHDTKPTVVKINPESPSDDLKYLMTVLYEIIAGEPYEQYLSRSDKVSVQDLINDAAGASERVVASKSLVQHHIKWALDMIEGKASRGSNVPGDRAYRGFSLFNHSGHKRVKRVMPTFDADGHVTGGEVTIHQLWYGGRIQSDTMFLDFGYQKGGGEIDYANCGGAGQPTDKACRSGVAPIPPNKPWKIHFQIHVLNKGNDDFSPMTMHFDCPSKLNVNGKPVKVSDDPNDHCPGAEINIPIGTTSWSNGPLYASTDQTFFPMNDGTRVEITLKMAPPQFYNLSYSWGWRIHSPRAQAVENGEKVIPPPVSSNPADPFNDAIQMYCHPMRAAIIEHERWAFEGFSGPNKLSDEVRALPPEELFSTVQKFADSVGLALPEGDPADDPKPEQVEACFQQFKAALNSPHFRAAGAALQERCQGRAPNSDNEITPPDMMDARLCLLSALLTKPFASSDYDPAINKIADIAPVKRMWRAFRALRTETNRSVPPGPEKWIPLMLDLRNAYLDWLDRNHLPSGIQPDPKSDLTLLYVNNTIYGELRDGGYTSFPDWRRRGDKAKLTLLNGDYFPHGYLNVDFGGARGWENLWKSTIKTAGSGPWFSFGRFHARFNTVPGSIAVGSAKASEETNEVGAPNSVTLAAHRLMIEFNFEPNPRLRFYQFDPLHHDAAIYSVH
jgi:hypothetical protein